MVTGLSLLASVTSRPISLKCQLPGRSRPRPAGPSSVSSSDPSSSDTAASVASSSMPPPPRKNRFALAVAGR